MTRKLSWYSALLMVVMPLSYAAPGAPGNNAMTTESAPVVVDPAAPLREDVLPFSKVAPAPGSFDLRGTRPQGQIEFGVRSDEVVTKAVLNLHYRPSPSLLPVMSHLKIYLNDELVGLVTVTADQLGKSQQAQVNIDPRFIGDFNRIRLELVGHYTNVCENPAYSSIWLDVGKESSLDLSMQKLPVKNDLSHFPEPFFDSRDSRPLSLPMVFAAQPDLAQQKAAAMLASWFGVQAEWHGQAFPVLYNQLPPQQHAVVFATNDQRPDFLKDYPAVQKPTVEIISRPDNPYQKLLLVMGRNDQDLITAVRGIAQGDVLLRGQLSTIDSVKSLAPRQPYDAPRWVRTDRPTTFSELQQYENQFQASGMQPAPITLNMNLPPDLFLIRARGIDMDMRYRYTSPLQNDGSRLAIHLNEQFMQDYPLSMKQDSARQLLHIPLIQGLQESNNQLRIPALRLGVVNQMRFDFDYATTIIGGTSDGRCETVTPVGNHIVIDGDSTVDFSGYRHFMQMPSLGAFANAGFPFSRNADLAQTLVLVKPQPSSEQVSALLNALGNIGAQTGYPALNVQISDDWSKAKSSDADLLMIGVIPQELRDESKINLLVDTTKSWVNKPNRQTVLDNVDASASDRQAESQTTIGSTGPMGAIVGFQSPFHDQRSVVALLADSPRGWELLNNALLDSGKRAAIYGSVAIVRESGVNSLRVGDNYDVGYLPWWERLWNALATHPVWLALFTVVVVILFALLIWRVMRLVSRRRLGDEDSH
ncbi:cellulose biosynthesis cyclic di-GMP-binding regulatory protein BcsB [Erwiniaceae bacterium BAC15a-03b]|uniref:Cyclic di-GMP-binding protein n=1 Tax=Winslowiella arboricola TaxID=2978220 RepID=A0A9J6PMU5_9GAMM|nr:cellulose biosynthesis cyclic di-GMP-binding regulatory protein BcsB [Winslowiella arboricola]MCU5773829.1 cellulose biosynthesis cyclic di-GMP-binding regulatory protein BcsB [Winslowiella arboricola]MCU5777739.1 cellulose biosynthesis cyclic di-GMP-binding regulatory protein BcsB [Winslowiella arboricola]